MLPQLALALVLAAASPASAATEEPRDNWPTAHISADPSQQFQEVDGWGCSEAFKRAEDAQGLYGLSPTNITYLLDLMFDVNKGAGFTILR